MRNIYMTKVFKTGAEAQDAIDELIADFSNKVCPLTSSCHPRKTFACIAADCALFNEGMITSDMDKQVHIISTVPHCGLCRNPIK